MDPYCIGVTFGRTEGAVAGMGPMERHFLGPAKRYFWTLQFTKLYFFGDGVFFPLFLCYFILVKFFKSLKYILKNKMK